MIGAALLALTLGLGGTVPAAMAQTITPRAAKSSPRSACTAITRRLTTK